MVINRRLTAVFAYKAAGVVPIVLYLGHDADEAMAKFVKAQDKSYFEVRFCSNVDSFLTCLHVHRWRPDSVLLNA